MLNYPYSWLFPPFLFFNYTAQGNGEFTLSAFATNLQSARIGDLTSDQGRAVKQRHRPKTFSFSWNGQVV